MSVIAKIRNRMRGGVYFTRLCAYNKMQTELKKANRYSQNQQRVCKYLKKIEWLKYIYGDSWKGGKKESKALIVMKETLETKNGMVQLDKLSVPIPLIRDVMTWSGEFIDILAPYIFYQKGEYNYSALRECFGEGPYEFCSEVSVDDGDVVFDCGSNMGLFAAIASARGASKVYAFEPSKKVIDNYLIKTVRNNENIEIASYALSDYIGTATFKNSIENIGASALIKEKELGSQYEEVQVITIDEFVKRNNIKKVDFIKADIEGAERDMLRGAKDTLKKYSPKLSYLYISLSRRSTIIGKHNT